MNSVRNHVTTQYDGDGRRMDILHKKDKEITVLDLWHTWSKSEVHNWTVEQTAEWLVAAVDLPQYRDLFIREGVAGNQLPKAAVDTNFLQHKLGITSSLHRSKISLKAMDVVLFGPPKDANNWLKDVILTSLLLALLTALFWAYKTKKHSEEHLSKMMKDMESLAKAERALQDMQSKLTTQEKVIQDVKVKRDEEGGEEVGRLREEVEILRGELQRAEVELEDKCWMAPTMLQHWLQLTYEMESQVFNTRKKAAEFQMEQAKDACDKLKKKRSSLVGAFVSTHGRFVNSYYRKFSTTDFKYIDRANGIKNGLNFAAAADNTTFKCPQKFKVTMVQICSADEPWKQEEILLYDLHRFLCYTRINIYPSQINR